MNIFNEKMMTRKINRSEGVVINLPEKRTSKNISFGITNLSPDKETSSHSHEECEEIVYIIRGKGIAVIDSRKQEISEGDLILIRTGEEHQLINKAENTMKVLFATSPPLDL